MLIVCFISDVEAPSRSPAAEGPGADVVDDGMQPTLVADPLDEAQALADPGEKYFCLEHLLPPVIWTEL